MSVTHLQVSICQSVITHAFHVLFRCCHIFIFRAETFLQSSSFSNTLNLMSPFWQSVTSKLHTVSLVCSLEQQVFPASHFPRCGVHCRLLSPWQPGLQSPEASTPLITHSITFFKPYTSTSSSVSICKH